MELVGNNDHFHNITIIILTKGRGRFHYVIINRNIGIIDEFSLSLSLYNLNCVSNMDLARFLEGDQMLAKRGMYGPLGGSVLA